MADNENILTIDLADDYKIKIESAKDIEGSFFRPVYEQALRNTAEIVANSLETERNNKQPDREYNNIIAFIGERGTGKSSSMRTFLEILTEENSDDSRKWIDKEKNIKNNNAVFH
jgi:predicted AAA+ superfamily ATPase